jgi:carbon-monoxide dehydrogenase medium subunit
MVLGGILSIQGVDGCRETPLEGFFLGPGKTALKPGDIVTSIHFPLPPQNSAGTYIKLGRNKWSDLAIVGVTAFGWSEPSAASGYRFHIALASVAPVPLMVLAAQEYLESHPASSESLHAAALLAQESCNPIDDVRGSARYRKAMVRNLVEKALNTVWQSIGS